MARSAGMAPASDPGSGRSLLTVPEIGPMTARGRRAPSALITPRTRCSRRWAFATRKSRTSQCGRRLREMLAASRPAFQGPAHPWDRIDGANRRDLAAVRRNARTLAVIEEVAVRDPHLRELSCRFGSRS